jgi:hypothetical protein
VGGEGAGRSSGLWPHVCASSRGPCNCTGSPRSLGAACLCACGTRVGPCTHTQR